MSHKKLSIISLLLLVLVVTMACEFSASTAGISGVTLSKDKDGATPTTVFAPADAIYCVVKLANAPDDTKLKAVWSAVQVEGVEPNKVILEKEITSGASPIIFSLTNDNPWPVGKYKVDINMNDKLEKTLEFQVK